MHRRPFAWAGLGLALLACSGEAPPITSSAPIRLVEVLSEANVLESPLLDRDAAVERDGQPVFSESFDDFPEAGWRWPDGATVGIGSHGEPALRVLAAKGRPYKVVIPAEGARVYRIRRSIEPWRRSVDLVVSESSVELRQPEVLNHPTDYRPAIRRQPRSRLIRTHLFPEPEIGRWQTDEIEILTAPLTRSLEIAFSALNQPVDAWIDDLSIEVLTLPGEQRARWLRDLNVLPGSDASLGIAKHGQLLPLVAARGDVGSPDAVNYAFRSALYAPTPTRLRFELDVPSGAALTFATGLARGTRPDDEATWEVVAEVDGRRETVFSSRLHADEDLAGNHWREWELSLAGFGGRRIALELVTRAPPGQQGLALWGSPIVVAPRAPGSPPNVLVIAVDTLRADRLSVYGHRPELSPHIAELASDGVKVQRAYSSSNWTTPSFATLFTGLMPSRHRVDDFGRTLSPEHRTLAEAFAAEGWLTHALIYKVFLYDMGLEQGFDMWFNQPSYQVRGRHSTEMVLDWLNRNGQRRFFLFWHLNDPHQPFNLPDSYLEETGAAPLVDEFDFEMPAHVNTGRHCRDCRGARAKLDECDLCGGGRLVRGYKRMGNEIYDSTVHYVDDQIGRVVQALKERDLYEDTLIVFVADHGEMLWDRAELFGHSGAPMYQELVRIPLILKPHAAAGIPSGQTFEEPVPMMDIGATLLQLAGASQGPSGVAGRSFAAELDPGSQAASRVAVIENIRARSLAVKDRRWSLHVGLRARKPATERLFDLASDPGERKNVIDAHPDVAARLRGVAFIHLLRNRAGRYLVLKSEPGPVRIEVEMEDATPELHWGLPHQASRFEGTAPGPVALFARLPARTPPDVEIRAHRGEAALPTMRHELVVGQVDDDWLARLPAGAHLVRVDDPVGVEEKRSLSDEQRRELEALGYVE